MATALGQIFALSLVSALGLVACTSAPTTNPINNNNNAANPAALYCVEQGGIYESEDNNSYCLLPDGQAIEAWEFYLDNPQLQE